MKNLLKLILIIGFHLTCVSVANASHIDTKSVSIQDKIKDRFYSILGDAKVESDSMKFMQTMDTLLTMLPLAGVNNNTKAMITRSSLNAVAGMISNLDQSQRAKLQSLYSKMPQQLLASSVSGMDVESLSLVKSILK